MLRIPERADRSEKVEAETFCGIRLIVQLRAFSQEISVMRRHQVADWEHSWLRGHSLECDS